MLHMHTSAVIKTARFAGYNPSCYILLRLLFLLNLVRTQQTSTDRHNSPATVKLHGHACVNTMSIGSSILQELPCKGILLMQWHGHACA